MNFSHSFVLVGFLIYLGFGLLVLAAGGYVLGWSFRKGWDRAGRASSAPTTVAGQLRPPA